MSSLSAPALISRSAAIPGTSLPTLPGSACRVPKEPSPPRVAVCREPKTVAIDPTNHTIYVTNSGDGTVSVLPRQPVTGDRAAGAATPHTGCPRKRTTADNPSPRPFRRRLPVINCQDQGLRILGTKPATCQRRPQCIATSSTPSLVSAAPRRVTMNSRPHRGQR
jgi:hypothetical protein